MKNQTSMTLLGVLIFFIPISLSGQAYLVKDINTNNNAASSTPYFPIALGDTYFCNASNGKNGRELWKSDGTSAGTIIMKDIFTGFQSGLVNQPMWIFKDKLYFLANDGKAGIEMWTTDANPANTNVFIDLEPGLDSSNPTLVGMSSSTMFFSAIVGSLGRELYKTDGTVAGTTLIKDIRNGSGNSNPEEGVMLGNNLFFKAEDGTNGIELWKTDGTAAGTTMVKNINAGSAHSRPTLLTTINGMIIFIADDGQHGNEMWRSDGTDAGTKLIKDIRVAGSSNPSWLTAINDIVYFTANDGSNGVELWRTDGTDAGTYMVKDINPGSSSSSPALLTKLKDKLIFRANDGTHGEELWKSLGTADSTYLVSDIVPGSNNSGILDIVAYRNYVYFDANMTLTGEKELWKSDGTAVGTSNAARVWPGMGSTPNNFIGIGNRLFFSADGSGIGHELWAIDVGIAGPDISKCPITRNINGCSTNDITNPVYSSTIANSTIQIFSDNTNQGAGTNVSTVKHQDKIVSTSPVKIERSWIVSDSNGNSSSCIQQINVIDNISPVFTIKVSDTTLYRCNVLSTLISATDNCSGPISVILNQGTTIGQIIPLGTTKFSYTATDASGNTSTKDLNVSIVNPLFLSIDSVAYHPCYGNAPELIINANNQIQNPFDVYINNNKVLQLTTGTIHRRLSVTIVDSIVSVKDANACETKIKFNVKLKDSAFVFQSVSLKNPTTCQLKNGEINLSLKGNNVSSYWFDHINNVRLPANQSNKAFGPGTYSYHVFNKPESDTSACHFVYGPYVLTCPSKIIDIEESTIMVQPNPAGEYIVISSIKNEIIKEIQLLDVFGHELIRKQVYSTEIKLDLHDLPSASYFVRVEYGKRKLMKMIMKD